MMTTQIQPSPYNKDSDIKIGTDIENYDSVQKNSMGSSNLCTANTVSKRTSIPTNLITETNSLNNSSLIL